METFLGIVTTVATVVLALLTGKYIRFTREMVEEMRTARRPYVFVDLEFQDGSSVVLIVGNSGALPARNVSLSVVDQVPWTRQGLDRILAIKHGISYLAPERRLKYEIGSLDWKRVRETGGSLRFRIRFETDQGKEVRHDTGIDLTQYVSVTPTTFESEAAPVERALRSLERAVEWSRESSDSIASRWTHRSCPICGERISAAAKKCPHCLEFLPEKPRPAPDQEASEAYSDDTESSDPVEG